MLQHDIIEQPGIFKIPNNLPISSSFRFIRIVIVFVNHLIMDQIILEVCIDSIASGIAAEAGGASRIELCSALSEGGLTPTVGFLRVLKTKVKIPIFAMIRPRAGDFLYSADEVKLMIEDIRILKANGADGFVFGVLTKSGDIDTDTCKLLLSEAKPLPVTFHRAFDQMSTIMVESAVELLIELGFSRILTSGQHPNAKEGIPVIKKLVSQANGRISIMAGAGVSPGNVGEIVSSTGVTEVHASARKPQKSLMETPENLNVTMGTLENDFVTYVTDSKIVGDIIQNAQKLTI